MVIEAFQMLCPKPYAARPHWQVHRSRHLVLPTIKKGLELFDEQAFGTKPSCKNGM